MTCLECGNDFTQRRMGRPRLYCSTYCRYAARRCKRLGCQSAVRREGLCYRHLRQELRKQRAWNARDEILDWLDLDGGWLTAPGLAADLGRNYQAVERVLRQLRSEGLVTSRVVELAHAVGSIGYHQRTEWRAE